jgi:hypothetical protein
MKMTTSFSKQKIAFGALFILLGFLALQVPVTTLAGSKAAFTLFDAFAPVTTAFVSSIPGVIAVFCMEFVNFLVRGAHVQDIGTIIRFFPILFAAFYFGKKSEWNVIIPLIAIAVWLANPVGREVWYYSLYWTIPVICYFFRDKFILARTLGATFTAHAVGGAAWVWAFHLPASVWNGLIPVVALERLVLATGMAVSYLFLNNLVYFFVAKKHTQFSWMINMRYVYKGIR